MNLEELNELDFSNIGVWPFPIKLALILIACVLVGGGLIVFAMAQNPQGYSAGDVPRIVMDLFR